MDTNDFAQLARDEQGQFLTIIEHGDVYYAHHGVTAHLNTLFGDIFSRVYVAIHSNNPYTLKRLSLKNERMSVSIIDDNRLSIDVANLILERHNGSRISMTWSEWGDIEVL